MISNASEASNICATWIPKGGNTPGEDGIIN